VLRPSLRLLAMAAAIAMLGSPAAHAQRSMNLGSEYGIMVSQAVHTIGGIFVDCSSLPGRSWPASAQVACARLPRGVYGYFRLGVHGRLYGYLSRGALRVVSPWHTVGNNLEVVYDVQGGTLTVEREWDGGSLYAVFEYLGNLTRASSKVPGH
jgi:hypothetical protein